MNSSNRAFSHCHACGSPYENDSWPRICGACGLTHYRNPTPVAVALVPTKGGLLGVKRAQGPGTGQWALPGGFVDDGESAEMAAAREVWEETGVKINPDDFRVTHTAITSQGQMLIFCGAENVFVDTPEKLKVISEEIEAIGSLKRHQSLAFPLHSEAVEKFFDQRSTDRRIDKETIDAIRTVDEKRIHLLLSQGARVCGNKALFVLLESWENDQADLTHPRKASDEYPELSRILRALMEYGADVLLPDENGVTPLEMLRTFDSEEADKVKAELVKNQIDTSLTQTNKKIHRGRI